jgi:hypothetical protein
MHLLFYIPVFLYEDGSKPGHDHEYLTIYSGVAFSVYYFGFGALSENHFIFMPKSFTVIY